MSPSPLRLAVLASGSGSTLQALIDAQRAGELSAQIGLVVVDRAGAYALQRALQQHIPAIYLPLKRQERASWAAQLAGLIDGFAPDLLVFSGWMKVMTPNFIEHYAGRMINQHPALLPDDDSDSYLTSAGLRIPALRGAHTVRDALERRLPVTGCTVHRVTREVDIGPILGRSEVEVLPDDSEETLHERIKGQERKLLIQVINQLAANAVPSSEF